MTLGRSLEAISNLIVLATRVFMDKMVKAAMHVVQGAIRTLMGPRNVFYVIQGLIRRLLVHLPPPYARHVHNQLFHIKAVIPFQIALRLLVFTLFLIQYHTSLLQFLEKLILTIHWHIMTSTGHS